MIELRPFSVVGAALMHPKKQNDFRSVISQNNSDSFSLSPKIAFKGFKSIQDVLDLDDEKIEELKEDELEDALLYMKGGRKTSDWEGQTVRSRSRIENLQAMLTVSPQAEEYVIEQTLKAEILTEKLENALKKITGN